MKNLLIFIISPLLLLATGCSPVPLKPVPDPDGIYVPPAGDQSSKSYIESKLHSSFFGELTRARVESVDKKAVPLTRQEQQPPVEVSPGKHLIVAICEPQIGSIPPRAALEVELKPAHIYALKCKDTSSVLNLGTDIYIEDMTDGSVVISKERTWAPNLGGMRRNF